MGNWKKVNPEILRLQGKDLSSNYPSVIIARDC
jgi:hypothetical protein